MKRFLMVAALVFMMVLGASALPARAPVASAPIVRDARAAKALPARDEPLLVNADYPLPEGYQLDNLVNLYEQEGRAFQLAASDICLEKQVFQAMNRMFKEAASDGVDGFIISSGYRSREHQQRIYDESPAGIAALPGTSEHESGLAFDVTAYGNPDFAKTAQFAWLNEHCWDHGFIIRYPDGKQHITGIRYEPWHYRFVGVEVALALRDSGETLEEYMEVA